MIVQHSILPIILPETRKKRKMLDKQFIHVCTQRHYWKWHDNTSAVTGSLQPDSRHSTESVPNHHSVLFFPVLHPSPYEGSFEQFVKPHSSCHPVSPHHALTFILTSQTQYGTAHSILRERRTTQTQRPSYPHTNTNSQFRKAHAHRFIWPDYTTTTPCDSEPQRQKDPKK